MEDADQNNRPLPSPSNQPSFTPLHWLLIGTLLILFAFFLYVVRDHLSPLILALAMLLLLYPFRRRREVQMPLLLLSLVILSAVWSRFHSLLIPFIVSFVIAYALNPLVEWLVARKLPRLLVIVLIIGMILGAMVGLGFLIVPRLVEEAVDLASNVPQWIGEVERWGNIVLLPWLSQLIDLPVEEIIAKAQAGIGGIAEELVKGFSNWSVTALKGMVGLLSGLLNIILIPILTVYYLNEYDHFRRRIYHIIPPPYQPIALELYNGVNRVLTGYIHGQMLVILFLSSWIGLGLWLIAGVPYALLLGITAGFLNLLPYIGPAVAFALTLIVSLFQADPLSTVMKAALVFLSAQLLESNYITPRLVGDKVGLHPLAVIFLVLLFASLLGIIGMLIAIPVGAVAFCSGKVWWKSLQDKRPSSVKEQLPPA